MKGKDLIRGNLSTEGRKKKEFWVDCKLVVDELKRLKSNAP
jgi:hypothetical protein